MHRRTLLSQTAIGFAIVTLGTTGCETVSLAALHGIFIEDATMFHMGLVFDKNGCRFLVNTTVSSSNAFGGTVILTSGEYTLVNTTVRITGGTTTEEGKMLTFGLDSSGGGVLLLEMMQNGQVLEYKNE